MVQPTTLGSAVNRTLYFFECIMLEKLQEKKKYLKYMSQKGIKI